MTKIQKNKCIIIFSAILFYGIFGWVESSLATVFFSENFNSGSSPYSFGNERELKCTTYPNWDACGSNNWAVEHLATGGWNGTGGARLIFKQGQQQNAMGWYSSSAFRSWQQGDYFYVRFRIKFDSTMRWDGTSSQQNKMFIWGAGTYNGENQRIMLHQEKDHGSSPCADMSEQYSNSNFGLFSLKRNIQAYCTPPTPVTYDTWYHIQFYAKSGTTADATDAELKIWVNNNEYSSPSNQFIGGFNLAVSGIWNQGFSFGGFWSDLNSNRDVSWIVDDFQIADNFDLLWYPGIISDTTAPSAPSGLSVL